MDSRDTGKFKSRTIKLLNHIELMKPKLATKNPEGRPVILPTNLHYLAKREAINRQKTLTAFVSELVEKELNRKGQKA
jgi:hypothetical protein